MSGKPRHLVVPPMCPNGNGQQYFWMHLSAFWLSVRNVLYGLTYFTATMDAKPSNKVSTWTVLPKQNELFHCHTKTRRDTLGCPRFCNLLIKFVDQPTSTWGCRMVTIIDSPFVHIYDINQPENVDFSHAVFHYLHTKQRTHLCHQFFMHMHC